ncbi:MAG: GGDEF domain-containing protein [Acidobacteriota bacterium]
MDSKLVLIIQLNGVFLITILSFFLRRSVRVQALKYWTVAWLCLSVSLICLRLAFTFSDLESLLLTYYFLGQYIFGYMLVIGCRTLNGHYKRQRYSDLTMLPFVAAAIGLPLVTGDFQSLFELHSLILSGFYFTAFIFLRRHSAKNFGWRVMHVALLFQAVDYFLLSAVSFGHSYFPYGDDFLTYNPVVDLVLQTTLGFGMVIILLEKVLADARNANEKLETVKLQLEQLVDTDPLTAAFNRHAFYGFVKKNGNDDTTAGCVGFFDIDDLKSINDSLGHAAGDIAIRTVARSIREIIRSEDLIFRWGGDEFFVIMMQMSADMAEERMLRIEPMLRSVSLDLSAAPVSIGVSWGFTDFQGSAGLESAIKDADKAMYRHKRNRKKQIFIPSTMPGSIPMSNA